MNSIDDKYSLRFATPEDRVTLSRLFPAGTFTVPVNVVVALSRVGNARQIGAVSAAHMPQFANYQFVFDFYTLPGYMETALHSLLLEKLLSSCPPDVSLLCRTPVPLDSPAADTLASYNFQIRDVIHAYELPYAKLVRRIARLNARLLREKTDRDGFLLQSLADASLPAVAKVLEAAGLMSSAAFQEFCRARNDFDAVRFSSVATYDGLAVGVMLVMQSSSPDAVSIPCVWIHPQYRNTWLLTSLYDRSINAAAHLSINSIHFSADTKKALDTVNLANRLGGQLVSVTGRFERGPDSRGNKAHFPLSSID